jgi:hypothetical protein
MTFGMFSTSPRPPEADKRCQHCGAPIKPGKAEACWLCLEQHSIQEGMPRRHNDRGATTVSRSEAPGQTSAWAIFGGLAILVCIGLAIEAPGALVMFLILATPALIRTLIVLAPGQDTGTPAEGPTFLRTFLASLGVTYLVSIAAGCAFSAAFFAVCTAGLVVGSGGPDLSGVIVPSLTAGTIAGLVVAAFLFWLFWGKKRVTKKTP